MSGTIEVEKRLLCNPQIRAYVAATFAFVKESAFEDIYYDTSNLDLLSRDAWLRRRENAFELKIAQGSKSSAESSQQQQQRTNVYKEVLSVSEIAAWLDSVEPLSSAAAASKGAPFSQASDDPQAFLSVLQTRGFEPLCRIHTQRTRFEDAESGLHLDVDECRFLPGDAPLGRPVEALPPAVDYSILEIEKMIEKPEQQAQAEAQILDFAQRHGFISSRDSKSAPSKVFVCLKQSRPDVYERLASFPCFAHRFRKTVW